MSTYYIRKQTKNSPELHPGLYNLPLICLSTFPFHMIPCSCTPPYFQECEYKNCFPNLGLLISSFFLPRIPFLSISPCWYPSNSSRPHLNVTSFRMLPTILVINSNVWEDFPTPPNNSPTQHQLGVLQLNNSDTLYLVFASDSTGKGFWLPSTLNTNYKVSSLLLICLGRW